MKIYYKYLLVFIWMLVIFVLSSEVADVSSGRSAVIVDAIVSTLSPTLSEDILTFVTRKAAHIFAYFVLGVLLFNVVREYVAGVKGSILLAIALACVYAISDEVHQMFVPGRSGELRDVLIDTAAAAIGVGLYYFIARWRVRSSDL